MMTPEQEAMVEERRRQILDMAPASGEEGDIWDFVERLATENAQLWLALKTAYPELEEHARRHPHTQPVFDLAREALADAGPWTPV